MKVNSWLILCVFLLLSACKNQNDEVQEADFRINAEEIAVIEEVEEVYDGPDAGYISMIEFFADQWQLMGGQPYTFQRFIETPISIDSVYVGLDEHVWKDMSQPFKDSDINDAKFKGAYTFEIIEDDRQNEVLFLYTAKFPYLEVKTTQVRLNKYTNKITSIYIERNFKEAHKNKQHKLLYIIGHQLQIHELVFQEGKEISNIKKTYKLKF